MKITLGIYNPSDLLKPKKETAIRRRGRARAIIADMNPSSGIWMVSIYRRNKLQEQRAVYTKGLALEYIRAGKKTGTFKEVDGVKR